MKCIILPAIFFITFSSSYSQIEDILKHIPGVGDVFEEAVTTSIKDAYPTAYWLAELDKQVKLTTGKNFSPNLESGYYRFHFNTFCLQAGTYAPTQGDGYLVAPLKGSKAGLIKNILTRFSEHPEVDQKDVQMLIWGIEAGMKFSNYPNDFQLRITPLLSPEDIAKMEVDLKEIAYDLLPADVQNVLNLYSTIRAQLSNPLATYEQIEQIAVLTGIAPKGKGSKNIDAGTWTSIGDGVYMRCFPEGYKKSNIEIYMPTEVNIQKDNSGRIISLDDGSFKVELQYDASAPTFKSAVLKNIVTNEKVSVENNLTDEASLKKQTDDFLALVKKSFGKKKSKRLTGESLKSLTQLKSIELTLSSLIEKSGLGEDGYGVSANALYNLISGLESGNKKGGGNRFRKLSGLGNLSGMVNAPANTSGQRLGNGGPEGGNNGNENGNQNQNQQNEKKKEKKNCDVNIVLHDVVESQLPEPDGVYSVSVDINIEGDDPECLAEEIEFTLYDVSKERGRFLNDMEKYDDVEEDLQVSDMNQGYDITKTTAKKQLSGQTQSLEFYVWCRDYGAFGKVSARVKVKGQWYQGYAGSSSFVTIPLDKNNNKIADSWEKKNNVLGKTADWDEDPKPSGLKRNGDGMTNYEEYRGFFVLEGSGATKHQRMDPMQKEIFVIDRDEIFDVASWKAASGIEAYWLNLNQVFAFKIPDEKQQVYRWVNFCVGFAPGLKYAVNLRRYDGINNPDAIALCGPDSVYTGCNNGLGVKNSNWTFVMPDRIKKWLTETKNTIDAFVKKHPTAKKVSWGGFTYSIQEIKKFIKAVNDAKKFNEMTNFWVNQNVLHEVGHALGADHHGHPDTSLTNRGDTKCPMRYVEDNYPININSRRLLDVFKLMDKYGDNVFVTYIWMKFCKSGDNCLKQMDANDR